MNKKIGFFGGSFDPIHFGHLNLAFEMMEKQKLDQVLFCPANRSPHKKEPLSSTSIEKRVKMVELAIKDIPSFQLLDLEAKREGISYTVDTLKELKKQIASELYLILGFDTVKNFPDWKNPDEILSLAHPLVGTRGDSLLDLPPKYETIFKKSLVKTRRFDISSEEIRNRVHSNQYIGHLVPTKVVDYIYENLLY